MDSVKGSGAAKAGAKVEVGGSAGAVKEPLYGMLVIGPPGSGKSTFCAGMSAFLECLGRDTSVVNLDPACDLCKYECCIDIGNLVSAQRVAEELSLGPNGSLVYAMEYLNSHRKWLIDKIRKQGNSRYFIFDMPGQCELYTHNSSVKNIVQTMKAELDIRLVCLHLVDSTHCSELSTFLSASLLSLSTMLQLELPHLNILSKADLFERDNHTPFDLSFFTSRLDLLGLSEFVGRPLPSRSDVGHHIETGEWRRKGTIESGSLGLAKFQKLHRCLAELVQEFRLVNFIPLNVLDAKSMSKVLELADKAIGYAKKDRERAAAERNETYAQEWVEGFNDASFIKNAMSTRPTLAEQASIDE